MSKEEIQKKLDSVKKEEFYLQMKDMWSNSDYQIDREYKRQINELEELLAREEEE